VTCHCRDELNQAMTLTCNLRPLRNRLYITEFVTPHTYLIDQLYPGLVGPPSRRWSLPLAISHVFMHARSGIGSTQHYHGTTTVAKNR